MAAAAQGFIQFRLSGERTHLDVDTLNEQLRIYGAARMRHSMRPDEAFGLIFSWDNVVADTRALQLAAWQRVADGEGLHFPAAQARRQIFDIRPERAVTEVGCPSWHRQLRAAACQIAIAKGLEQNVGGRQLWKPLV